MCIIALVAKDWPRYILLIKKRKRMRYKIGYMSELIIFVT